MAEAGVNGVVTADVLTELSNDTVLTTEWINGGCLQAEMAPHHQD